MASNQRVNVSLCVSISKQLRLGPFTAARCRILRTKLSPSSLLAAETPSRRRHEGQTEQHGCRLRSKRHIHLDKERTKLPTMKLLNHVTFYLQTSTFTVFLYMFYVINYSVIIILVSLSRKSLQSGFLRVCVTSVSSCLTFKLELSFSETELQLI